MQREVRTEHQRSTILRKHELDGETALGVVASFLESVDKVGFLLVMCEGISPGGD